MVFYVIKLLIIDIDLLRYDDDIIKLKYKKYVDVLETVTSEPTERYENTECPSILNTYTPSSKPSKVVIVEQNNINNNTNIIIITTTIISFFIIFCCIIYYLNFIKKKKKEIFIYDDHFGVEIDEIIVI